MAASQTSVGWTCRFNYVFIHFFDGFIVNYRFASAFIPESRADVNVVGGSTHLSDPAQFDTPTREDRRESPSERAGSGLARQMLHAHRDQVERGRLRKALAEIVKRC
jgi:hypothetical protein